MEIGDRINLLRTKNHMTLEELGNKIGVGKSTVRKWETGMIKNIGSDKIELLGKTFGVSPAWLMGWENDNCYNDPEVAEIIQRLHDRPEMKILFNASKNVAKEDIEKVIAIVDCLPKNNEE